jgi:release factor glutamine methyltransferase
MRNAARYIVSKTYQPLVAKYLNKTRNYSFMGIRVEVPPGVFHPGLFSSTRLLLQQLFDRSLQNRSVLELGAGTGLISIYTAREGAKVLAIDISPASIECLERNRKANRVHFDLLHSDLFDTIPPQSFDLILINPPYYKKDPANDAERAWYCGAQGEYFQKLFRQLRNYMHRDTEVLMVLCDGCDLEGIKILASENALAMVCVKTAGNLIEQNFIFKIEWCDEGA